ncbi:hypothetical protein [Actinokineospora sp. NBRC 105648]|uniref:hypothetical protein n=1 Tax=Actinokineospora sp. NBRC 105648 TaxID=3032206 RepID=UPI0024A277D2|nr:hypothetical protein [Actinokineospora sp. NBRC 105648]GLZ36499.1 hypothetical protein Acsp05_01240 [Actinokineospora sp. NBRC 105648]
MTLLWIIGAVIALVGLASWRLRRAAGLLDRILVEEHAGAERDARRAATETEWVSSRPVAETPGTTRAETGLPAVVRLPHPARRLWPHRRTPDRLAG